MKCMTVAFNSCRAAGFASLLAAAFMFASTSALALSPEFLVGEHGNAVALKMKSDGNYAVFWNGSDSLLHVQYYAGDNKPQGASIATGACTSQYGGQDSGQIAMADDGSFVCTYNTQQGLFAQRIAADGSASGPAILLEATQYTTSPAVVAGNAHGDFVASWLLDDSRTVVAQRFDATGSIQGDLIRVGTSSESGDPSIAMDASGNFMVVWSAWEFGWGPRGGFDGGFLLARRYNKDGTPTGLASRVNTLAATFSVKYNAIVTMNAKGDALVYWISNDYFPQFRLYPKIGLPSGSKLAPAEFLGAAPSAALANDGSFVLLGVNQRDLLGQRYTASGKPSGKQFILNESESPYGSFPEVAYSPVTGDFVTAWTNVLGTPPATDSQVLARSATATERICTARVADQLWLSTWNLDHHEADGSIWFSLTRSGAGCGAVSVDVITTDNTATAGQDYLAISKTFHWANDQLGARTFKIKLLQDDVTEPTETFDVRLINPVNAMLSATSPRTSADGVMQIDIYDGAANSLPPSTARQVNRH